LRSLPRGGLGLLEGGLRQIQPVLRPGNSGKIRNLEVRRKVDRNHEIRVRSGQLENDVWKSRPTVQSGTNVIKLFCSK
jgi:hypothetical protein